MDKISKILVPFNFSRTSRKALDYAVDFMKDNKEMGLILAYITQDHNTDMLSKAFDATVKKYDLKNRVEWLAMSGSLTESLIDIQKKEAIDLVIMGTFRSNFEENSSDSNTSELVLAADCPVLVVPYNQKEFRIKHIALVLGKEKIDNTETLNILLDVARRFNAKVHVVTIENKSESYGYSKTDAENENTLAYYLESFYEDHTFIRNPDVVEGIFSYVSKKSIDMIAILPRNHAKKSQPSKGQLTQSLTLRSEVPILAID